MKAARNHRSYCTPIAKPYAYPGAADPRYFAEKLHKGITALATGMSATTVFFLLIIL